LVSIAKGSPSYIPLLSAFLLFFVSVSSPLTLFVDAIVLGLELLAKSNFSASSLALLFGDNSPF